MRQQKLTVGILAHVDAGKTTLAEGILYTTGTIRKMGRVDHKDAFLDTDNLEKERGITIFSKQAEVNWFGMPVTLLDTPGHVDFSAEMERALWVMDYAILVVNGSDGVQSHTATLWRLLEYYNIPVFLFINKMDQLGTDREQLLAQLKDKLSDACIDFSCSHGNRENTMPQNISPDATWHLPDHILEEIAMCKEDMMENYLENGTLETQAIRTAIKERMVFPCFFGSALKNTGVEAFLKSMAEYMEYPQYTEEFGARIYKITRDDNNQRLTHMKITGGSLKVKGMVKDEKVDQIRIYSGSSYSTVDQVNAGDTCAVTGLLETYCGQGIGIEKENELPILEPVLSYELLLPPGEDAYRAFLTLKVLEEEEPHLHMVWDEQLEEIHIRVMGEVEMEILKKRIWDIFHMEVEFSEGGVVYKETIASPVEGVGHFEPLKHYAEVHLLLEPLERGSGLVFDTKCSEDVLAKNWQRLILTHLKEKAHKGVLVGGEITDMKLTIIAGRAHIKHTEGGDFREATYRAIRQGLKKAESILLEPYYEFRLSVPTENVGRAMADIQKRAGEFGPPTLEGDMSVLSGRAPVSTMGDYGAVVLSYTRGMGRLFLRLAGYDKCHNMEEVLEKTTYDSEMDFANPTGSVFCAHGAGFVVDWQDVEAYMHVESPLKKAGNEPYSMQNEMETGHREHIHGTGKERFSDDIGEDEISEIMNRTFAANRKEKEHYKNPYKKKKAKIAAPRTLRAGSTVKKDKYLLVDGYNVVFAWEELKDLSQSRLDSARGRLLEILCNYQGYTDQTLIVVFDAYKVSGNPGEVTKYKNIYVVYTKEAETADMYIEKTVHKMGKDCDITVATSDRLEQMIIFGDGARYLSQDQFREEIESVNKQIREDMKAGESRKNFPFRDLLS